MEKRVMNKRGQPEGIGLGTVLAIIVGVVVLVVLIIGFTKGFDFIFGKWDLIPGTDLQTLAKSCEISGGNNLAIDYCSFKKVKIEGENEERYVNCEYGPVANAIASDKKLDPGCAGRQPSVEDFCETIKAGLKKDVKINGITSFDCKKVVAAAEGVTPPAVPSGEEAR